MRAAAPLSVLVSLCARRPVLTVLAFLLLVLLAAGVTRARLGVSTDLDQLFSASLPWKQQEAELKRLFPQFSNLMVAVIDGASPEEADATAAGLAAALSADSTHFRTVRRPDASPWFERNGLLFLDQEDLQSLLDRTIDAQPFLGQLSADPSARGLFAALALLGMGVERGEADLTSFGPALQAFHAALRAAIDGHPRPLSWQNLLAGKLVQLAGPYRLVLAQPVLDYGALEPGGAAGRALRQAADGLEFVRAGTARVRLTGSVPLADEEFATVADGALAGLVGSLVLVAIWLFLALRTWRLVLPVLVTLLVGLALTTGFAALAVGTLNLISVAFAVLFVGIAVDFGIQFAARLAEAGSLAKLGRRAGPQIGLAAAATAAGFLAFTPTPFSGVAELGLIAGVGMLIAFACTMTLLPALISLLVPQARVGWASSTDEMGLAALRPLDRLVTRGRWVVLAVFAAVFATGLASIPHLRFDSDPLSTKDPNTEAVRTLRDLEEGPLTNPYSVEAITAGPAQAADVAERLRALPLVDEVITLTSLVPADQEAKLPLLEDAASLLTPTLAARQAGASVRPEDVRLAARTAQAQLVRAAARLPAGHPVAALAADLQALSTASDTTAMAANESLTRFLPQQLARLRTALSPTMPVGPEAIPAVLARDWRLPDGRVRVQATGKPEARSGAGMAELVAQARTVDPRVGGTAVAVTETAVTIVRAFQTAAGLAMAAIAIILALALRRVLDVLLVLAPLTVSAVLTVLGCTLLPLTINFANVIALPLLLGVGVSFNVYFVMNWRAGRTSLLGSATARAVLFSALTTATAFGSLSLSRHPGTASMGNLLLLSLGCTLATSLLFLPALLAVLPCRNVNR